MDRVHVALVLHGLPQPSSNGGPMTAWALLRQLLDEGHSVSVLAFKYPSEPFHGAEREEAVRALGASLSVVPVDAELASPAGTIELRGRPSLERLFPTRRMAPVVQSLLTDLAPDAVFVYHWDTLAATHGFRRAPRFAAVDDLWHEPNLRRWQHSRPEASRAYVYWSLSTLRGTRPTGRAMVELLNDCAASGAFQSRTAAWLRSRGATGCAYLRAPLVDAGGPEWRERRLEAENPRPRILLGPSHLGATSTRAGLRVFAREILPALERALGPEGFEVRLVGEGDPPQELAQLLPRPSVTLTGRIEPADEEFLRADVQLVPTPFVLGKRVRIIVAWSFGCPVVAHAKEAVNLPELEHEENALLGRDGHELAAAIVKVVRERRLALALGTGGRRTFETLFHPSVAGHALVEEIVALTAPTAS